MNWFEYLLDFGRYGAPCIAAVVVLFGWIIPFNKKSTNQEELHLTQPGRVAFAIILLASAINLLSNVAYQQLTREKESELNEEIGNLRSLIRASSDTNLQQGLRLYDESKKVRGHLGDVEGQVSIMEGSLAEHLGDIFERSERDHALDALGSELSRAIAEGNGQLREEFRRELQSIITRLDALDCGERDSTVEFRREGSEDTVEFTDEGSEDATEVLLSEPPQISEPPPATLADLTVQLQPANAVQDQLGNFRIMQGDEIDYTITVGNDGPAVATGVEVTTTLPDGMDVSETDGCTVVDHVVHCMIGDVEVGQLKTVKIGANANSQGAVLSTAVVFSSGSQDPKPDNNQASSEIRIRSLSGLFATVHSNSLIGLDENLKDVFVGLALHNPVGSKNGINQSGLAGSPATTESGNPVAPLGQRAILNRELDDPAGTGQVVLGLDVPSSYFMLDSASPPQHTSSERADGLDHRILALPMVSHGGHQVTTLYLFNRNSAATTITVTLFKSNAQLKKISTELAPAAGLLASLDQLFGKGLEIKDGFLCIESEQPIQGFAVHLDEDRIASEIPMEPRPCAERIPG